LMGASLPAIVRWVEATPRGVAWWGLLYGGNTVGAVFGCLSAGFWLLRVYDTAVATYAAAAINLLAAALILWLADRTPAHAGIAWTAYMIADSLPYWPIDTMLTRSPWQLFQLDMVRCLWAVLPPAILWGASVPLALAAVSASNGDREDPGRVVGGVYAANTLGAIAGALSVSLVLIPWIGTQNS